MRNNKTIFTCSLINNVANTITNNVIDKGRRHSTGKY